MHHISTKHSAPSKLHHCPLEFLSLSVYDWLVQDEQYVNTTTYLLVIGPVGDIIIHMGKDWNDFVDLCLDTVIG